MLARLRELVDRAARFGIDVYLYYATNYHHPVPQWFYEKHPDCKGCAWDGSMCTSSPKVQEYLAETTRNLFTAVPRLKGLVMIFDSEGFYNCAVWRTAPNARDAAIVSPRTSLPSSLRSSTRP